MHVLNVNFQLVQRILILYDISLRINYVSNQAFKCIMFARGLTNSGLIKVNLINMGKIVFNDLTKAECVQKLQTRACGPAM